MHVKTNPNSYFNYERTNFNVMTCSHMFQLSRFEHEALLLRGQLPSSRFFLNSRFLRCQIFMNFSSRSHLFQTQCKSLGWLRNQVRALLSANIFTMRSRSMSTKALIVLALAKEVPGTSVKTNRVCNSRGYSRKVSLKPSKIQLSRHNLREQQVLKSAFFRFSESLKSKILAIMVPPPGYIVFSTNLPF